MSRESIYQITNLTKEYNRGFNRLSILKGLDLKVDQGQAICIKGPSGSGKSTLLHLLGALDRPTSGELLYRGKSLKDYNDSQLAYLRRSHLGFVFQFHHLLGELTALENVMIPAYLSKKNNKSSKERAKFLLETLGLTERKDHYPSEMSGGEQQRVAIARALMNEPQVLLADEPVGNLDRQNAESIRDLFFDLHDKFKLTLIAVSHDPLFSEAFPRILCLEEGRIKDINAVQ